MQIFCLVLGILLILPGVCFLGFGGAFLFGRGADVQGALVLIGIGVVIFIGVFALISAANSGSDGK